jgi:hypothetical protein
VYVGLLLLVPGGAAAAEPVPAAVSVGGGAVIWYYQPFFAEAQSYVTLIFANLVVDAKYGRFGLHIEPRFRDAKLRPFFDGPIWIQEAYAHATFGRTIFKVGKVATQLGYFWDGSYYGNVQMFDGIKLDFGYGLSAEGTVGPDRPVGARWWLQYFLRDGGTNYSLPGRDTISIPGAHRRNELIGRLEPFWAPTKRSELRIGASGEFLETELPNVAMKPVMRFAADFQLRIGPWRMWGEYLQQRGQTVTDFPIAPPTQSTLLARPALHGGSSAHNQYYWAGTELSIWRLTARYSFSLVDYSDVGVREWIHLPSLGARMNALLTLVAEFAYRQHSDATGVSIIDKALVVTLHATF